MTAFAHTSGSRSPKVAFVGEAWGAEEETHARPFVGQSGREFARMLAEAWNAPELNVLAALPTSQWLTEREAWLTEYGVLLTNVFALRPQNNNLAHLCAGKEELPSDYYMPAVRNQAPRYVRPEYLPELSRLREELTVAKPNLVVALGGTASWALLGLSGIGSIRGAVTTAKLVEGLKTLPTYHPAGVLYQWGIRGTVIADLVKAQSEMLHPEIRRPKRQIIVAPTLEELDALVPQILSEAKILSIDIETLKGQIRCVGFAWKRDQSLVIPLIRDLRGNHYWPNEASELRAWKHIRSLCEAGVPKLFQNGLFDLQYLTRAGIVVKNCSHDTMLLHHVMYPELPKGLGFLGSVYTNEQAWKLMRRHGEELKRDE